MKTIDRITFDPEVMGDKPSIRGLRIAVGTLVGLAAAGRTRDEILRLCPYLEDEDIVKGYFDEGRNRLCGEGNLLPTRAVKPHSRFAEPLDLSPIGTYGWNSFC
jgi:uncharacterized protein (DUF433 family)